MQVYHHESVLVSEVLDLLQPQSNQNFIDATVGGGGHAEAILEKNGPQGNVLGCDLDLRAINASKKRLKRFGTRAKIIQSNYTTVVDVLKQLKWGSDVDGIIADFGFSSDHMVSGRGFSFRKEEPLDMRFDNSTSQTASDLILNISQEDLVELLRINGEVRNPKLVARKIIEMRDLHIAAKPESPITTSQLVSAIPVTTRNPKKRIHPATQVFQALRIAVNNELENIKNFLPIAIDILKPNGVLAVISFHSLEDRIVKEYFRGEAKSCICPPDIPKCICDHKPRVDILTKKPQRPSQKRSLKTPEAEARS